MTVLDIAYAVRNLLLADSATLALLSTRMYPNPLPEGSTYPAIGYQQISEVNVSSHSGNSNQAQVRLQLTLWANTHTELVTLRDNLKRVLRDYRGTVGGIRIDRIEWANDISLNEPVTQIQQRHVDLLIWYGNTY